MHKRIASLLVSAISLPIVACTVENSDSIKTERIYSSVSLTFDTSDQSLHHFARFTIGNVFGNPVHLQDGSSILSNGKTFENTNGKAIYELRESLEANKALSMDYEVILKLNGNTYRNKLVLPKTVKVAPEFSATAGNGLSLPWTTEDSLGNDALTLTAHGATGAVFIARVEKDVAGKSGKFVFDEKTFEAQKPSVLALEVVRSHSLEKAELPEAGGSIRASTVVRVPEIKVP